MSKTLVIVESPGKITKIQHILGNSYLVMASVGHIIDLDKKSLSIDLEKNYEPIYTILHDKHDVVRKLIKAYKNTSDVLLATDEDREGEMIAWSLAKELKIKDAKRIVFNSITEKELKTAVKNPRPIDNNLVDAQKLRRVLDRIIGYRLSPLLWKSLNQMNLSAGRVQSVVVKLIIEKENEIKEFFQNDLNSYFKVSGEFTYKKSKLEAILYEKKKKTKKDIDEDSDKKKKKKTKKDVDKDNNPEEYTGGKIASIIEYENISSVMKSISKSTFKITDIFDKEHFRNPSAPFTTSTLQQEASSKLGFTSKRTMISAQHLYEAGYITYMRTDSISLSEEAMKKIEKYVKETYGNNYYRRVQYKSKSKNTQEAHEAIRPSDPNVKTVEINSSQKIGNDEIKLYNLIWKRSIASQMAPAKINITSIIVDISKLKDYYFVSQIKNILFKGFLIVYDFVNIEKDDRDNDDDLDLTTDNIKPKIGSELEANTVKAKQTYQHPPSRYNEASLVNKLDPNNLNIGRPSTYASIIEKIQKANYIVKKDNLGIDKEMMIIEWDGNKKIEETTDKITLGKDTNRFTPTTLGIIVTDFLIKYFNEIMDYKFTAHMEELLDEVAEGKIKWVKVLDKFYKTFQPLVDNLTTKLKDNPDQKLSKEKVLGKHPTSGYEITALITRYGEAVKMTDPSNPKKYIYAPIKLPLTLDTIKLDEAVKLFEYPKNLGKYGKKDVLLQKGKFGFYLKVGTDKITLDLDEETVNKYTLEDAIKVLNEKKSNELWSGSDSKFKYIILEGPYGKYINAKPKTKTGKSRNYKLPEKIGDKEIKTNEDIKKLTLDDILKIISEAYNKPRKGFKKNYKKKE